MIEELFVGNSPIQRIDPRVRILAGCGLSVMTAASKRFSVLFLALAIGLSVVMIAGIPLKALVRRLIPVNLFILFLWLFLPFTYLGESVFSIGSLIASREGLLYAAQITVKSNAIILMLIALAASTPIFTLVHAMRKLGMPEKMVQLFFFTYRYIHVVYMEYQRLLNAVKIRGFTPGTNLHTYKTVAYMVGMLLVKSADRAQRVHNAMLCRGFNGNFYSLTEFSMKKADIALLIAAGGILLLLGAIEWKVVS